ncbi:hypothetical protein CF326_g6066 [Tilletia indica]|nr:hypothetical protein CF326_g6066 [Tilletia indica]
MRSSVSMDSPPYNGSDRTYDGSYYTSTSESEAEEVPQDDPRPDVWQDVRFPREDPPVHQMSYLGAIAHILRRVRIRERDFMTRNPALPLDQRWSLFFRFACDALSFEAAQSHLPYRYYSTMVRYVLNIGQHLIPWAHRRAQRTPDIDQERIRARNRIVEETQTLLHNQTSASQHGDAASTPASSPPVHYEEIVPEPSPQPSPARQHHLSEHPDEALETSLPFLHQFAFGVEETSQDTLPPSRAPVSDANLDATPTTSAATTPTGTSPRPRHLYANESPISKRRRVLRATITQRRAESAARKAARNWRGSSLGKENVPPLEGDQSAAFASGSTPKPFSLSSTINSNIAGAPLFSAATSSKTGGDSKTFK